MTGAQKRNVSGVSIVSSRWSWRTSEETARYHHQTQNPQMHICMPSGQLLLNSSGQGRTSDSLASWRPGCRAKKLAATSTGRTMLQCKSWCKIASSQPSPAVANSFECSRYSTRHGNATAWQLEDTCRYHQEIANTPMQKVVCHGSFSALRCGCYTLLASLAIVACARMVGRRNLPIVPKNAPCSNAEPLPKYEGRNLLQPSLASSYRLFSPRHAGPGRPSSETCK